MLSQSYQSEQFFKVKKGIMNTHNKEVNVAFVYVLYWAFRKSKKSKMSVFLPSLHYACLIMKTEREETEKYSHF